MKRWPTAMIESDGDYRKDAHIEQLIKGPLYKHHQPPVSPSSSLPASSGVDASNSDASHASNDALPRLPVPSIQDTIQRFLPTALPLARSQQERTSLRQACDDFPQQAQALQQRLVDRRQSLGMRDSSWLQEWWNQMGYLQVRDPVVVNVSYFFHFVDDPTLDYGDVVGLGGGGSGGVYDTDGDDGGTSNNHTNNKNVLNVQRGAAMLYSTAEFRKMVCSGRLEAESVGRGDRKVPLCSAAYKYMFNACRVPRRRQDAYRMYDPSRCSHAVVSRRGYFFSMEVVDAESQDPLPMEVLEDGLRRCIAMADELSSLLSLSSVSSSSASSSPTSSQQQQQRQALPTRCKVGLLTSQDRDDWADGRQMLLDALGDGFRRDLERLESGAILLNLDDECPVSRRECGEMCWTGGAASGHNRWFDKSIQVCVSNNGKGGFLGEHSMMDGMPCVRYADYITGVTYAEAKRRSSLLYGGVNNVNGVNNDVHGGINGDMNGGNAASRVTALFEDLDRISPSTSTSLSPSIPSSIPSPSPSQPSTSPVAAHTSAQLTSLMDKAEDSFRDLIDRHSLHVQSFHGYGSAWMKRNGFSPDAFVQAAMQVGAYRLFGEMVGTYEATQVRRFLHGRTETTRTVSLSMESFVKMMGPRAKLAQMDAARGMALEQALKTAVQDHNRYMRNAAVGQGVDRHLLGLSLLVRQDNGERPPRLFSDDVFVRSKRWRVSTSQLSHPRFALWGYGEVVSDGVGLAYSIHPTSCVFSITALKQHGWTDKLAELLEEALLEMRLAIESSQEDKMKSRL
eukprot:CAMPEP_0119555840 /NCGR_PEP_ID=MMETSP1352-20130426/7937_1 /TAXON_ID=265584 /ORGANISM="Stauroneis constricta, Strain CCMP1120" /LENGTH=791 /DNA_ID=CAMNT_0007602683 /DNA_START=108 /DNA_END=2483 /DNA_ORIENTATION=-